MKPIIATHWGSYQGEVRDGRLVSVHPTAWDARPSAIGQSLPEALYSQTRVRRPAIRKSFLVHGPDSRNLRGSDEFVELSWEEALPIVAGQLERVIAQHGNSAVFGGSYGWSSAGRFHHAQSQVHRFLNSLGGYTYSKDTYSVGAGRRILPYVIGDVEDFIGDATSWSLLAEHCEVFVSFGGLPTRNTQVTPGGANNHRVASWLDKLQQRGVEFVNIGPARDDMDSLDNATWLPIRPGTDAAVILALCHVLISENLFDRQFVGTHTVGFDRFSDYVLGVVDGTPKTCEWAARIADCSPAALSGLAHKLVARRSMLNITWSLQRAQHGEQPFFALVALGALLGQIGTPGGGLGFGYSTFNDIGSGKSRFSGPRLPQGKNPVTSFIPVARISDMLLSPGQEYSYDGMQLQYPDIRLLYWAGGNVFHHHQDINKLIRAWRRPEVVITHEAYWTAQAKFSDIVLPATVMTERNDIGSASRDGYMIAMKACTQPVELALDDYEIFTRLSELMGSKEAYTEGRSTLDWLKHLYEESRERATETGIELPDFEVFWRQGCLEYRSAPDDGPLLHQFRADPARHPLATSSGKIELFSATLDAFKYADCPGHAAWLGLDEFLGSDLTSRYPLHMLSPQPATRLHSQYDHGVTSRNGKIHGREPIRIHPRDAAARNIGHGDVVRVYNDRGQTLAAAVLTDALKPGVVQLATGAWYDPLERGAIGTLDKHGNPNVLTRDIPSSQLGQGCAAQSALVEIERWTGSLPPITAFDPPPFSSR